MQLLDVVRRRPVLFTILLGAMLGIIVGMFLPIRASAPPDGGAFAWDLPSAESTKRFSEPSYVKLKSARFWTTQEATRTENGMSGWQLLAIMTRPSPQVAVVATNASAGKAQQNWIRLGGTLPDGSILVAVDRDAIWFTHDGCRSSRKLYANPAGATAPDAPDCKSGPAPNPARREASGPTNSNGKPNP